MLLFDELYRVYVYYICILFNVEVNLQIIIVLIMRGFLVCGCSGGKGGGGVWKKMWKLVFFKEQIDGGIDEQKDEGDFMSFK